MGVVESLRPALSRPCFLLPGAGCSARSYAEVMAEPTLAGTRLIAVTLPGQAGAPAPKASAPSR